MSTIGERGYSQNNKETHSSLYKTLMVDYSLENPLKISFSSLPNKGRKAKWQRGQKPVTTSKEFCQINEVICRVKPHSGWHSHNNLCLRVILKKRKFLKSAAQTFPCSQKRTHGEPGTYTGALAFWKRPPSGYIWTGRNRGLVLGWDIYNV